MKFNFFLRASFCLIFTILICSCGGSCDEENCGNNGTCIEGSCICDDGYTGISCNTEKREKFLGNWISNEVDCDILSSEDFDFSIEPGTSIEDVVIKLKTGSDLPLSGKINGDTINIPSQNFGTTYFGDLILQGNQLKLKLFIIKSSDTGSCNITATK